MDSIGFIGAGNMAEALIKGTTSAGILRPENIFASDIRSERLDMLARRYGVGPAAGNRQLASKASIVVLSVKPQDIPQVLEEIAGAISARNLVISIAAGIRTESIASALGDVPIVRVMPNTPALVGEGASALFANEAAAPLLERAVSIFSAVGKTVILEDEDLMDAVTAVSGSGPAYYFLLTESLMKAATRLGLSEETARELLLQTAKGAAVLACEASVQGQSCAELRRRVTSRGGTTEAALKVLTGADFERLVAEAVEAARDRSRELSG
jgi:pyrroline-5-carboxylate reductase